MSTYSMTGAAGFLVFMIEDENEQQLWDIWLHKETEHSDNFEKFKQASIKKSTKKTLSKKDEQAAIAKAQNILKRRGGS